MRTERLLQLATEDQDGADYAKQSSDNAGDKA
jgi:hypothetical protein